MTRSRDTETSFEELVERFGVEVADIVMEVTDDKALPSSERKQLQIAHAHKKSNSAALVKIADKTCNLRDLANSPPGDWSVDRQREYYDWAKKVVDALPLQGGVLAEAFDRAYSAKA